MSRLPEHVKHLPDWPARMGAPLAAAYLGIGESTFQRGVSERRYPAGRKDGGRVLWHRAELDEWLAAEREGGVSYGGDPYLDGLTNGDDSRAAR